MNATISDSMICKTSDFCTVMNSNTTNGFKAGFVFILVLLILFLLSSKSSKSSAQGLIKIFIIVAIIVIFLVMEFQGVSV